MKILKSGITKDYAPFLREWIIDNQDYFFSKIFEAHSWHDFERFDGIITSRKHLVLPKELFLVDRKYNDVHQFVVCYFTKAGKLKELFPVVKISEVTNWRAGYYLIPNILPIK